MAKKRTGSEPLVTGRGWRVYRDYDRIPVCKVIEIQSPVYGGIGYHQIICPPDLERALKAGKEYMELKAFLGQREEE